MGKNSEFKNPKFISVRLKQFLNILSVNSRDFICSGKYILSKDLQSENAKLASIKSDILNIEISTAFKLIQPLKILFIDVNFEVLKFEKLIFSKLLQF